MRLLLTTLVLSLIIGGLGPSAVAEEDGGALTLPELAQSLVDGIIVPIDIPMTIVPADDEADLAQACCRYCCRGKPCGNSCINRQLTCHQPPGCACAGC